MEHSTILEAVELFEGATPQEISSVAALCQERTFAKGDIVTAQGDPGDELFVVCEGFVEVLRAGVPPEQAPRTVVHLGAGQIFGEMALVDRGPRSATVKAAADETRVLVIQQDAFERLCEQNHHLGYIVMRNIAADLSFKLRHHHLTGRCGNSMAATYKVSYVVSGEEHPGAILNTEKRPMKGDMIKLGSRKFTVVEVIDLMPPKGGFRYLHATLQTQNS